MENRTFARGVRGQKVPLKDRFWDKVDRSGGPDACWPWLAARRDDGYGIVRGDAPRGTPCNLKAHRVAWELTNGPIADGLFACHACDNTSCCNPGHLFLGTNEDNLKDAAGKGRMSHGEARPMAKLTDEAVAKARDCFHAGGVSVRELAGECGVSQGTMWQALRRKTWRHVA